jgi:hypothetical protein
MTPQEKAKELVARFYYLLESLNKPLISSKQDAAKTCAHMLVEEVIKNGKTIQPALFSTQEHGEIFWLQVKEEINKI